jgi:hypothetical protein
MRIYFRLRVTTAGAECLEKAICSAIANVKAAGYEVERVEIRAEAMPQPV